MYKLYLFGYPIFHSYSPKIYERVFKILKVDASYILLNTKKEELKDRIEQIRKDKEVLGFNLTQPLKEEILKFDVKLDEISNKIQSVNCVLVADSKLFGFNTDYFGFIKSLKPYKNILEDNESLVLGAGGASKSVILALKEIGIRRVYVANRTFERIFKLKDIFFDFIVPIKLNEIELIIKNVQLIVNTTTVGLSKDESLIDEHLLNKDMIIYDLIYNPSKTKLLKNGEKVGAKIKNGFTMLYFQCLENLKIWFGGILWLNWLHLESHMVNILLEY